MGNTAGGGGGAPAGGGGGAAAVQQGANSLMDIWKIFENRRMDKKNWQRTVKQEEWRIDQWNRQKDWSKHMWDLQNQYNHPVQAMARLKAAGINPHTLHMKGGQFASGQAGAPTSPGSASSGSKSDAVSSLRGIGKFDYLGLRNIQAQTDLTSESAAATAANKEVSKEKAIGEAYLNVKRAADAGVATEMAESRLEALYADIENKKSQTERNKWLIKKEGKMLPYQINLLAEQAGLTADSAALKREHTSYQKTVNKFLNERQRAEINQIYANISKIGTEAYKNNSQAALNYAIKLIKDGEGKLSRFGIKNHDDFLTRSYAMALVSADDPNAFYKLLAAETTGTIGRKALNTAANILNLRGIGKGLKGAKDNGKGGYWTPTQKRKPAMRPNTNFDNQ